MAGLHGGLVRGMAALVLGATALLPVAGHARADGAVAGEQDGPNLLVNGGFERGFDPGRRFDFPAGDTSALLQGWTLLNAGLDKFNSGVTYIGTMFPCEEGKRCLEIANGGENPKNIGGAAQTVATVPGQRYRFSFYQSADIMQTGPRIMKAVVAGQAHQYNYMPAPDEWQNVKKMRWILRTFTFTAGAKTTTVEFDSVLSASGGGSLIDNAQLMPILPLVSGNGNGTPGGSPSTTPAAASVKLGSATVAAGSQESVQVTTGPNAPIGLIIDYPNGTQAVLPAKAGADGRYSYSWAIPAGVHGKVAVLVDAAGAVTRGSFTVS